MLLLFSSLRHPMVNGRMLQRICYDAFGWGTLFDSPKATFFEGDQNGPIRVRFWSKSINIETIDGSCWPTKCIKYCINKTSKIAKTICWGVTNYEPSLLVNDWTIKLWINIKVSSQWQANHLAGPEKHPSNEHNDPFFSRVRLEDYFPTLKYL